MIGKQYNFTAYIEGFLGNKIAAINFADSAILILETQNTLTNDILFSYRAKGKAYQQLGDFFRANVALKMALYIEDSLQLKSGVLNGLGINELHIGNLNAAETYFKALVSDKEVLLQFRIIGKMNLTELYLNLKELDKAKEVWKEVDAYMKSIDIKEEPLAPDFFQIKSHLLQAEGHYLKSIKSLRKAIELLDQKPLEKRTVEKFRCDLVLLLLEDSAHTAEVECRKAHRYFSAQNKEQRDPFEMVSTHIMASVFYEQYQRKNQTDLLDSCLLYTQKAQTISDLLRKGFLYRNSKYLLARYLKENVELGIDAANELIKKGEVRKGQELFFYFMEKGKSQVLLDELDEKQRAQLKANGALETLYKLELMRIEATDSLERIKLSMQIEKAKSELKTRENGMSEQKDFFQADLDQLIQLSKQSSTVFLEFGEGQEYPYVLMINDGHLIQKQISVSKDSLNDLIKRHLFHLKTPTISIHDYTITGNDLYSLLLEPLAIEQQNIVIIPSDLIAYLPFESLVTNLLGINSYKKLPYAIGKWNFSYVFSSAFLSDLQTELKQSFCGLLPVNQKEGDLSSHEDLMNSITSKFRGEYFQKETPNTLTSISEQHGFIHISSHGTFSRKHPMKSYLFMPGSDSSKLTIEQLYSTTISGSPFIVLNACETGEGELRSGEGIDNFTRAFFYSGASGVIESSWKINANQTAIIFNWFYNSLLDGTDTKAALRTAKLTYLKDQNTDNHFAHPYYWAGFRHFGTAVSLQKQSSNILYWLGISAGAALLILGFRWRSRRKKKRS
ncbi:MAG: CHAT domain-containing protein [Flavobacteriales bacterium]|nr:CHAT domain-containing protein [Flavobacteriales bacterium]